MFWQIPSAAALRSSALNGLCVLSSLGALASVASHHRPLRNVAEPSPTGVFLTDVRPDVCRHGCDVAVLGRSASVCLPSLQHSSSGVGEGLGFQGPGVNVSGSLLASAPLVPGPSGTASGDPPLPATKEGSSQTTPLPSLPLEPVHASADCLSYLRRSARQAGFSDEVAGQLTHCRRRSTCVNYQAKWVVYRCWCYRLGHSVSRPTVVKVADFLLYLRHSLSLSYSSIASYRSMLSGVFRFILPELSSHTLFFMTCSALFAWSVLSLPLVSLLGIFWWCSSFFVALCLSHWTRLLCGFLLRRFSFWFPWLRLAVLGSFRLCLARSLFLAPMLTSHTFQSFARRQSRLSIRSLAPFVSDPWTISWVTSRKNSFCVLSALCVLIKLVLPLWFRVLAIFLSLLVLLLVPSLRTLVVSFFGMSSLGFTRPPPLLLLLLVLLPQLLRLFRRMLMVFVGWLLYGRLRVMLLSLPSWLRLLGPLLPSSPSIFPMFSSRLQVVLV